MKPRLTLVPNERHVEQQIAQGRPAKSLARFVRELVESDADAPEATTPEITRLAVEHELGRGAAFSSTVDAAIGALRRAGVTAQELSSLPLPRAQLLGKLMATCDRLLDARGLRDEREDAGRAARILGERPAAIEGLSALLVHGITRWDALDLELFEVLHGRLRREGGEGLRLSLPNLRGEYTAEAVHSLATALENRWSVLNDPPSISFDPAREAATLSLSLVEAADEASEARAAARAVVDALADGAAIDRVAIVSLDLSEPFLEPLREELALAKIPFVEPRGRPPIAGPKVHAALELMRQSHGPLARDVLIDMLCLPPLVTERWFGRDAEETRYALLRELAALPLRTDRTRTELCEALSARARSGDESESARADLALSGLRAILADLERFTAAASREELGRAWIDLLGELGLCEPTPPGIALALAGDGVGRAELLRALGDNAQGARALVTAIERCAGAARALGLADAKVTPAALVDEVEAALSGVSQTGGAGRAGAISVARPEELAGLELDVAVICQASSACLDAARSGAETLLNSELREALPPGKRPAGAIEQRRFTLLALSSILSRARHSVVSFAGRERQSRTGPSRFFAALAGCGHRVRREPASPLAMGARRVAPPPAPSRDAERRARIDRERAAFFLELDAPAGAHTGKVPDLSEHVGGGAARPLALTAIERYARCPFLGFSGTLGATRDEAIGDAIGIRERGSLLHEALAHALRATRGKWGALSRAELEAAALGAARAFLFERGNSALRRAGLSATLDDVAAFLRWTFDHADYAFLEAERGFGSGHDWGALQLGPVFVSGRIDRIDASSDRRRLRIIDYKTGKRPTTAQIGEELLQPWLYALKVGREFGADHVETGYLSLNRRDPDWKEVYAGALDGDLLQQAAARAVAIVADFRQGHIEPRPRDPRSCQRCDARDLCRRPLSAPSGEESSE